MRPCLISTSYSGAEGEVVGREEKSNMLANINGILRSIFHSRNNK